MANVIEILIRAKDEATRQIQAASASVSGMGTAVKGLVAGAGVAALAVGLSQAAAAARQLFDSLADFAAKAEEIQNAATRTGTTAQQYQTLALALEEANIPAGQLTVAFRTLNNAIAQNDPGLAKLGVTAKDTWGAFLQLTDVIAATENTSERVAIATAFLGARMGESLIPVLEKGSGAFVQLQREGEAAGSILSNETLGAAAALDDQLDRLKRQTDGLSASFMAALVPALSATVEGLQLVIERSTLAVAILTNVAAAADLLKSGKFKEAAAVIAVNNKLLIDHEAMLRQVEDARREAFERGGQASSIVPPDEAERLKQVRERVQAYLASIREAGATTKAAAAEMKAVPTVLGEMVRALDEAREMSKRLGDGLENDASRAVKAVEKLIEPAKLPDRKNVPRAGASLPPLPEPVEIADPWAEWKASAEDAKQIGLAFAADMSSAFSNMAQQVIFAGQSFGQAFKDFMRSILASIVDLIAQAIAKLIVSGLLKWLGALIGGPFGAGLAAAGASFGFGGGGKLQTGGGGASESRMEALLAEQNDLLRANLARGDTYQFNTLDTRTVYEAYIAPGGSLRRANDRLAEIAAVG